MPNVIENLHYIIKREIVVKALISLLKFYWPNYVRIVNNVMLHTIKSEKVDK